MIASTLSVEGAVTALALAFVVVRWARQWSAQPAGPGARGAAKKLALGWSDRDTIGLATAVGIVLAQWLAGVGAELVAHLAGITGLDAAPWAPALADVVLVALIVLALDLVPLGLCDIGHGALVTALRRIGLPLGPALRHSITGLLVPALVVAAAPLLWQTGSDAVHAIGNAPAPAACAPADAPAAAAAGQWGTPDRLANAATIVQVGREMGVPERGQVIAVATAMQESGLRNVDHGDRDSLGLFQQRPSQDWGTPAQVRDPRYAATQFYDRLLDVPDWPELPLWQAAQAVQHSGHPTLYADDEDVAALLVGAAAGLTCTSEWS